MIFADSGGILGGFGRPKWELRSNFDRFSAAFFSSMFGNRFLSDFFLFFQSQTLIFVRTASVLEDFYRIDGFLKNSKKKHGFLVYFWKPKRRKIKKKL